MENSREAVSVDPGRSANVTRAASIGLCLHAEMPFIAAQTAKYDQFHFFFLFLPQLSVEGDVWVQLTDEIETVYDVWAFQRLHTW